MPIARTCDKNSLVSRKASSRQPKELVGPTIKLATIIEKEHEIKSIIDDHSWKRRKSNEGEMTQDQPVEPTPRAFITSSPGKVIVFGEHSVVHRKAAIAAAIALRSYLLVTPDISTEAPITLTFPDIGLAHSWSVSSLPWKAFAQITTPIDQPHLLLDEALVTALEPHLDVVSPNVPEQTKKVHRSATLAFLYILLSICRGRPPPSHSFTMRSTIPIAAGLGSSASISVCIAAAVLTMTGNLPPPSPTASTAEIEMHLNMINVWAFVGEICIHGTPSGVDNTVATRGRAVLFKRNHPGKPPSVTPLHVFPVLPLLLVNTKQSRSTAVEVAKVKKLMDTHPSVTKPILEAMDQITETAHRLIEESTGPVEENADFIEKLGALFRVNHGLLVALGVSHPRLERIRELVDHAGIGYTKLTGAGGGGCAISLLTEKPGPVLARLEEQLQDQGFSKYETLLGGKGVGILVAGDNVTVANQKDFLQAKDTSGIEELVGVGDSQRGWTHWD